MLLTVEKRIRGEICNSVNRYAKANNNYMKSYDKNKESSYLKYWDVNNLYSWRMSQKLPVNSFERVEDISESDDCSIKSYNEESDEGYFLEADVQYPEKLHELHNDLPFLSERINIEKLEKLIANLHNKCEFYSHKKFTISIKS